MNDKILSNKLFQIGTDVRSKAAALLLSIGILWVNSRIKPRMYVTLRTMYKKLHFVGWSWLNENQFCSMWVQLHYFVNRINEVYSILWNVAIACFTTIELVIVLSWFL